MLAIFVLLLLSLTAIAYAHPKDQFRALDPGHRLSKRGTYLDSARDRRLQVIRYSVPVLILLPSQDCEEKIGHSMLRLGLGSFPLIQYNYDLMVIRKALLAGTVSDQWGNTRGAHIPTS